MQNIFIDILPPWVETGLQPAFYDLESGTVLQQTARMWAKMREMGVAFNTFTTDVTETVNRFIDEFHDLYTYVHDYFDNLDVQEEINNKLDSMVDDGTFADILKQVLDIATQDKLNFHTLMAIERNSGGLQGGCVLPDGTIIQFTGVDKVYRLATDGTTLNQADISVGHANGATYCSKTDTVFVTSTQDADIGKYKIFEINPLSLEIINTYDCKDKFNYEPYDIIYLEDEEKFVFINFWQNVPDRQKMWKTDLEFNVEETKTFNFEIRSIMGAGMVGKYIGVENFSKHTILLFEPSTMSFVKQITINPVVSDTWVITEEEWIDTRNGKVYLGFVACASANPHTLATFIYAKMDPLENYETSKYGIETSPHNEYYVVDHTNTNILRNGSNGNPFRNVYEALNASLKTTGVTGNVSIRFRNKDENNSYHILITMAKQYRFTTDIENGLYDFFKSVTVAQGASLSIEGVVSLVDNTTKPDYFDQGGADLTINGSFKCASVYNADNTRLYIKGEQNSDIRIGLDNHGIDVEGFYGVLTNTYLAYKNMSNLVTGFWPTNTGANHICEIRHLRCILSQTDGYYYIPAWTQNGFVTIKFKMSVAGVNQQFEIGLPYELGLFMEYPFFDENGNKVRIVFDADGKITLSAGTIERVILCN